MGASKQIQESIFPGIFPPESTFGSEQSCASNAQELQKCSATHSLPWQGEEFVQK